MKKSIKDLFKMKKNNEKIVAVTAYDYSMAKIFDNAGSDMLLVGDSLGMVCYGEKTTLNVTIDDIITHTKAVVKGAESSFVVADMPFMSFQISNEKAIENAGRIVKETGCEAVKFEGNYPELTKKLTKIGIPVVAHLGFTPQSVKKFGRDIVRGKSTTESEYIYRSAKSMEKAGAVSLIIEAVPEKLAEKLSKNLKIPVIGIGSGRKCDGEIQVCYDILGIYPDFKPKHSKVFNNVGKEIKKGFEKYYQAVKNGEFPQKENVLKE